MVIQNITSGMVSGFIPPRHINSRKGQNGKVLIVGGSRIYHGAPILASLAALRTGIDLAYAAVPKNIVDAVRAASCDIIVMPLVDQKLTRGAAIKLSKTVPLGVDVAAIGMGLEFTEGLPILLRQLRDMNVRVVLDAGALKSDIVDEMHGTDCILTPHAGEFYRLFKETPPDNLTERAKMVSQMSTKSGATILLKGSTDVISDGTHTLYNTGRVPAMTAGGTGDILCGVTAGIFAKNRKGIEAASAAAYINKQVGMLAQYDLGLHVIASDMIQYIPKVMKGFDHTSG